MKNFLRNISWAVYLCNSWVWCIGLFYPVLLFRDFGFYSWLIFTIPNVFGATIVPWFIKNAQASRRFTRQHAIACQAFSFITILFNTYFLGWILTKINLSFAFVLIIPLVCFLALKLSIQNVLRVSIVIFFASLIALILISNLINKTGLNYVKVGDGDVNEVIGLIPVFLIGFLFCPYFDLTFHRVIKQVQKAEVKRVYIVGFTIMFLCFLVLGINYYPIIYDLLMGSNYAKNSIALVLLSLYVIFQTVFTSYVHLRELSMLKISQFIWGLLLGLLIGVYTFAFLANGELFFFGKYMQLREILYRGFLSVYGLIVPLYFWIFVLINFDKSQRYAVLNKRRQYMWFIAILLALPFYVIGFYGDIKWIVYVLFLGVLLALGTPFKSVLKAILRLKKRRI